MLADWLDTHDPALRALAGAIAVAGPGAGFLLARRQDKARAAARARHLADAADAVAAALAGVLDADPTLSSVAEAPRAGLPAWTLLAPRRAAEGPPAWAAPLDAPAAALAESGLVLRLTGPWPAYGFARGVLAAPEAPHA
jgi:hypothetical protein